MAALAGPPDYAKKEQIFRTRSTYLREYASASAACWRLWTFTLDFQEVASWASRDISVGFARGICLERWLARGENRLL